MCLYRRERNHGQNESSSKKFECGFFQCKKSCSIHFGDPTLAFIKNIIECQQDAELCINNACSVKYVY